MIRRCTEEEIQKILEGEPHSMTVVARMNEQGSKKFNDFISRDVSGITLDVDNERRIVEEAAAGAGGVTRDYGYENVVAGRSPKLELDQHDFDFYIET